METGEIERDFCRINLRRSRNGELRGLTVYGGERVGWDSGEELLPGEIGELVWVSGEPGEVIRALGETGAAAPRG